MTSPVSAPLFHFTPRHLVPGCLRDGLTLGSVPVPLGGGYGLVRGYQWLTSNPSWEQAWAVRRSLPYDRTEARFEVRLPRPARRRYLLSWQEWAVRAGLPDWWVENLRELGGGDDGSWWLYAGTVRPEWLSGPEWKPATEATA